MKIKNLNIRPKTVALALTGVLTTSTLLTGCGNYDMLDTKYTYNKAIIFGENSATIVDVKQWGDYEGEQIQIRTEGDMYILTSSFDTKLIDDRESDMSAEDLARAIKGDDVEIIYFEENYHKKK